MQNKLSYYHSNVHKTNLCQDEHCTVSFEKQCKVHRKPSPIRVCPLGGAREDRIEWYNSVREKTDFLINYSIYIYIIINIP